MKKLTYSLFAVIVATLAFSCAKNINEELISDESASSEVKTFKCTFAEPDSKVAISSSTGKSTWEVGDQIRIHGGTDGATCETVTLTASDISIDGKTATISFSVPAYDRTDAGVVSKYYAQYPADAVPTGVNLYYESRFNNTNKMLMAACDVGDSFVFFNLCGVLSFIVDGDFDQVVFAGNNGETVGYDVYQARVRDDGSGAVLTAWKPGNGSGTPVAQTSITASVVADGSTVNYLYFPMGANFTGGFNFKFLKGGDVKKTLRTNTAKNVATGYYLPLPDITSYLKDPVKHDSALAVPADNSDYDLSKTASANCYIVDGSNAEFANKIFKFKAYKGKGTIDAGLINSVEVLWQTWNNSETVTDNSVIAAVDYDKQIDNDYYEICFKMPATLHAGNAVIAAKDDKDVVLWSWHIWVPLTPITSSTYGGISTSPMMDRNLGALLIAEGDADNDIDIRSCGMFYQWGRKDPFPGPKTLPNTYGNMATINGTIDTRGITASSEISKYPNSFVETGGDGTGTKDWSSDHASSLWGSTKNQNDPCPPGWKLPIFASGTGDIWDSSVTDKTTLTGYALNTTHHWLKLGVTYDAGAPTTTGFVYFPLAGYRTQDNSDYAYAGNRALIWQAYGEGGEYAKCLYSDGSFVGYRTERKGRGGNVRCIAE